MEDDNSDQFRRRFGERLRAARIAKGLSQDAVGAGFGIGKGTVSAWETGRSDPGVVRLRDLARLYGVTPNSLVLDSAPSTQAANLAAEFDQLPEQHRATLKALWAAYVSQIRASEQL